MGVCVSCGRSDEEPLGHCPTCTLGEQADPETDERVALRHQVKTLTDELAAAKLRCSVGHQTTSELELDRLRGDLAGAREERDDAERELDIAASCLGDLRRERDRLLEATAITEVALLRDEVAALRAHNTRMHSERDNALCVAMDLRSDREIYESVACGWAFEAGRALLRDLAIAEDLVVKEIAAERAACAEIVRGVMRDLGLGNSGTNWSQRVSVAIAAIQSRGEA